MDRLAKSDPGNAVWQGDLSASYEEVGDVLTAQGNPQEALKSYRDGLHRQKALEHGDGAEPQIDVTILPWRSIRLPRRYRAPAAPAPASSCVMVFFSNQRAAKATSDWFALASSKRR
jgi:hypothetical protein